MPEQPSQSRAKRMASTAERRTVDQPMLCAQVRNMGTKAVLDLVLIGCWACVRHGFCTLLLRGSAMK